VINSPFDARTRTTSFWLIALNAFLLLKEMGQLVQDFALLREDFFHPLMGLVVVCLARFWAYINPSC
jgi:hypothetical protein